MISRRGQAAPPRRSLPARARREGGKQGLGPGCGGRVECLEMAKNQVAGAGTRTRRLQEEAAQWDCADYLWGGGGGSRRGIHSQVSDCGEIGSVDKRCPVPEPPAPFSRALGSSPKVAAHPRDHPLQKTNNTLAEDDSLFETAIVRRAKSPPADLSPPPWRTLPLRPPRSGPPRAASGQAQQLDSGLGRRKGREVLSLGRRERAGHAKLLRGLSDCPSEVKSWGSGTPQRLGAGGQGDSTYGPG